MYKSKQSLSVWQWSKMTYFEGKGAYPYPGRVVLPSAGKSGGIWLGI